MNESSTIKQSIIHAPGTRTFVRTDGLAQTVESSFRSGDASGEIAPGIDICCATMQRLSEILDLGELRDAVMTFKGGVVVAARGEDDVVMAVVADSGSNVGLLLNHVRRLMTADDGEEAGS